MAIDPRFLSAPALSPLNPINPKVDPDKAWDVAKKFEQTFVLALHFDWVCPAVALVND